jgi:glycogen debranching enzyme
VDSSADLLTLTPGFPQHGKARPNKFDNFKTSSDRAGCGQISEIFDADAPHKPRGCPSQAWSVAEVLRVSEK